jgi:hypothetical protein
VIVQKFIIRGELPTRNESDNAARLGFWAQNNLKKNADALCVTAMGELEPVVEYPVRFRFLWIARGDFDPDNLAASKKYILDALQCCKRCAACEANEGLCTCRQCKKGKYKKCMCCPAEHCARHANILREDGMREISSFQDFFAVDKNNPRIIVELTEGVE